MIVLLQLAFQDRGGANSGSRVVTFFCFVFLEPGPEGHVNCLHVYVKYRDTIAPIYSVSNIRNCNIIIGGD